jgi:23S rRNA-/tRNA-specific pseudouridylate synthase
METPILETLPEVLLENDDYIAVNKPSSMPVHPCGNFCYNTLSKILEHEMKYNDLLTVHRLDR